MGYQDHYVFVISTLIFLLLHTWGEISVAGPVQSWAESVLGSVYVVLFLCVCLFVVVVVVVVCVCVCVCVCGFWGFFFSGGGGGERFFKKLNKN